MAGWRSDIGLGLSGHMRRRIDQLRFCGVVKVLQGPCTPGVVSALVRRTSSDPSWSFDCTRLLDLSHFLVRCRSERVLDELCDIKFFGDDGIRLEIEPWTTTWGCVRRLGCGDPRWIQVSGIPLHAWGKYELQEVFDMEGEVLEVRPTGSLRSDHIVASVFFDAADWDTLPDWIEKRVGDAPFRFTIRKDGPIAMRGRPQGVNSFAGASGSGTGPSFVPPPPPPQSSLPQTLTRGHFSASPGTCISLSNSPLVPPVLPPAPSPMVSGAGLDLLPGGSIERTGGPPQGVGLSVEELSGNPELVEVIAIGSTAGGGAWGSSDDLLEISASKKTLGFGSVRRSSRLAMKQEVDDSMDMKEALLKLERALSKK